MKSGNLRLPTLALSLAAALSTGHAALGQESEPNDTRQQASPATLITPVNALFTDPSDQDWYSFTLPAAASVKIEIYRYQRGGCPDGFDPALFLYDASGTLIASADDQFPNFCANLDTATMPAVGVLPPGTYSLKVVQYGSAGLYPLDYTIAITPSNLGPVQPESFTYQGVLKQGGTPVTGTKEMMFSLWVDPSDTSPAKRLSLPLFFNYVDVVNGQFSAELDFGMNGLFDGGERYLQIEVGEADANQRTVLEPRIKITPAAMANWAKHAKNATHSDEASFATSAGQANFAYVATTAGSADSVSWNNIYGKPAGIESGGPWQTANSGTLFYNGAVGIGTTTSGFTFTVSGTAAKPGGGTWSTFCDSRLKHDIQPLAGTLDRLLGLRGYTFEYNQDAVDHRLALPGTQIGLIAEEVERVFPDWVQRDSDGFRYVTERATTALMVEALRDLRAEKDAAAAAAQQQIESLKKTNDQLQARLDRLEQALNGAAQTAPTSAK